MTARPVAPDPFAALGLDPGAELTDDEVRAAWRRIAAATHPDRADGGDLKRFAAAAAAYTELRTAFGRGEARAALGGPAPARRTAGRSRASPGGGRRTALGSLPRRGGGRRAALGSQVAAGSLASLPARISAGRSGRLAVRVLAAAGAAALAILVAWPRPAAAGLVTGIATWLVLTGRHDLAPWSGDALMPRRRHRPGSAGDQRPSG